MFRRVIAAALLVVLAAALLVGTWPQLFGLQRSLGVAQFVAFRGLTAVLAITAIVVLLLVAATSPSFRRLGASICAVLLVFALAGAAVMASRGLGEDRLGAPSAASVTVVEWNTLGGAPGASLIAKLASDNSADVVSLPETNEQVADAVAASMAAAGHPMVVHTLAFNHIAQAKSTSVLIATRLGGYHVDTAIGSTSTVPTIVLRPDSGRGPVIVGVHAVAPQPGELSRWRSDLAFLAGLCSTPDVIMAGDFNATLDHLSGLASRTGAVVGDCADAAQSSRNAAVGTWPAALPALLGAPIDHVLATPGWRVQGMRVVQSLDGAGSDHRPIVVRLSPTG